MRRLIRKFIALIIILIVAGVVFFMLTMNRLTAAGVEKVLTHVLLVDASVGRAELDLRKGRLDLYDLVVSNPDGYESPEAFTVQHASMDLDVASLRSDTIVVEQVVLDTPRLTLEKGIKKSNVKQLIDNAARLIPEEDASEPEAESFAVRVALIQTKSGKVDVVSPLLDNGLTIPLPDIELHDIGDASNSATLAEAIQILLKRLLEESLTAGKGTIPSDVFDSLAEGVSSFSETLGHTTENLKQGAAAAKEKLKAGAKRLFRKKN